MSEHTPRVHTNRLRALIIEIVSLPAIIITLKNLNARLNSISVTHACTESLREFYTFFSEFQFQTKQIDGNRFPLERAAKRESAFLATGSGFGHLHGWLIEILEAFIRVGMQQTSLPDSTISHHNDVQHVVRHFGHLLSTGTGQEIWNWIGKFQLQYAKLL